MLPVVGDESVLDGVSEDDDPLETTSWRTSSPTVHVPCGTDGTPPAARHSAEVSGSADAAPVPRASEPVTKAPTMTLDNRRPGRTSMCGPLRPGGWCHKGMCDLRAHRRGSAFVTRELTEGPTSLGSAQCGPAVRPFELSRPRRSRASHPTAPPVSEITVRSSVGHGKVTVGGGGAISLCERVSAHPPAGTRSPTNGASRALPPSLKRARRRRCEPSRRSRVAQHGLRVGVGGDQLQTASPLALRRRRKVVANASSSLSTANPRTSRRPAAATPVAITTAWTPPRVGNPPTNGPGLCSTSRPRRRTGMPARPGS